MSEDLNPKEYFDFLVNAGVVSKIMDYLDGAQTNWELAV